MSFKLAAREPSTSFLSYLVVSVSFTSLWETLPSTDPSTVEVLGYIFRAIASKHQQSLGIYIIQVVLLLVAPALLAASIYMVLGRLMRFTESESLSPIRVNWLTKIFVCGDVFSFFVQSGGSYYFSSYFLALDRLRSIHERRAINPVLDVLGSPDLPAHPHVM